MKTCFQFKDMNILDHGKSVFDYFQDLHWYLCLGRQPEKYQWKFPDWIDQIDSSDLPDMDTMHDYMVYHDCGKPFCRILDENGKQHFPYHTEISYRRWLKFSDNMEVAQLIRMDMDAHTMKYEEFIEGKTPQQIKTLLISALCELHSNAQMFGGIESESFKIKFKRLNTLGKRCLMT